MGPGLVAALGQKKKKKKSKAKAAHPKGPVITLAPRQAPNAEPPAPTAELARAYQLHQQGDVKGAEQGYRQALEQNPELVDAWRNLGAMLRQQGRVAEGLRCTEEALKRQPNDHSLWGNLGNALRDLDRLQESRQAFERAIQLAPDQLGPRLGLAITLNKTGDYWQVIQGVLPILDGLPTEPNHTAADLLLEVGNAYHHLGQQDQALSHWKRALGLTAGDKQLLMALNMGQVLCELQRHSHTEELLRQQLQHHAHNANLLYALGVTAKGQGRWEEACERFEEALERDPNYAICLNTYGLLLRDLGRSHQARGCFERALAVDSKFGAAMNNLGSVLKDVARYPEALEWLRKGAEQLGDNPAAHSNVLFTLVGYELEPAEQRFAEARRFGERFSTSPFERWRDRIPYPDRLRRLRIGLVSPDFCRHAVSYFVEPLLERWDRGELEITLYACGNVRDDYTRRLQSKADRWRDIHGLSDEQAVLQILRDEIDILVDLAGHTAGNRLTLFARKPAPIQATYLGYYGTTGLQQVDYWITDPTLHPLEDETKDPCSEERWRLPRAYVTYRPLPEAPAVAPLPMLKRGFPMLGSFNQSRKITLTTAERWMAVLQAIPSAHLFLKSKNLGEPTEAQRIRTLFSELGLAPERLHLEGHSPSVAAHLERYREVDIALDTFPYTGCTTTADALWMGVPVLSVAGNSMVSRQAAAVLVAAGQQQWICNSTEELVHQCLALLEDPTGLERQRMELRTQLQNSDLLDHCGLAEALADSFRQWWVRWLDEQFPEPAGGNHLEPWPLRLPPPPLAQVCPYPR